MNTERPFTCWHRHMEGPALALVVCNSAKARQKVRQFWIEIQREVDAVLAQRAV
ncbi:MAG: hypothetical protein IPK27_03230 [Rhodanobacteraceae bacterium]|nr:hypothetical protein [Rhodanobacteraceae bacterium]